MWLAATTLDSTALCEHTNMHTLFLPLFMQMVACSLLSASTYEDLMRQGLYNTQKE